MLNFFNMVSKSKNDQEEIKNFSAIPAQTFREFSKKENAVVIDIRTQGEIAEGKIFEKALEIDFMSHTFWGEIQDLDKDKIYLIYCRSGARTSRIPATMKTFGFKEVYDLKGGIFGFR